MEQTVIGTPFPEVPTSDNLRWAYQNDPTVRAAVDGRIPMEDCVSMMAREKAAMLQEILRLKEIAPFKMRAPDGRVLIWRCPDNFVPDPV